MGSVLPVIHRMETNGVKRSLQRKMLYEIFRNPLTKAASPLSVACLPGKTGWDLEYFAKREEVGKLVGIERDPDLVRMLRKRKWGRPVEIFEGTVTEYLRQLASPLHLLYLDYCSNFGHSMMQDIDIILRERVLHPGGKCIVAFLNSRESADVRVAQQRLFEEADGVLPSGEHWDALDPDRQRCAAFNALLCRYRARSVHPRWGARFKQRRTYVGALPVHQWHRYSVAGGSMLTGYFTVSKYWESPGTPGAQSRVLQRMNKIYVRGNWAIRDAEIPAVFTGSTWRNAVKHEILEHYEKHGRTMACSQSSFGAGGGGLPRWSSFIKELGLCPNQCATLAEIEGELRRIAGREGVILQTHLKRAGLVRRKAVIERFGPGAQTAMARFLRQLGLPYDFRSPRERAFATVLEAWVRHLEEEGTPTHFPKYACIGKRGLLKYKDAVRELRRLQGV